MCLQQAHADKSGIHNMGTIRDNQCSKEMQLTTLSNYRTTMMCKSKVAPKVILTTDTVTDHSNRTTCFRAAGLSTTGHIFNVVRVLFMTSSDSAAGDGRAPPSPNKSS